jgi:hypothetical protein
MHHQACVVEWSVICLALLFKCTPWLSCTPLWLARECIARAAYGLPSRARSHALHCVCPYSWEEEGKRNQERQQQQQQGGHSAMAGLQVGEVHLLAAHGGQARVRLARAVAGGWLLGTAAVAGGCSPAQHQRGGGCCQLVTAATTSTAATTGHGRCL